jgi:hypothetical protein
VIWARASAPRGGGRATLCVLCLPLLLVPVGCRTYDGHRSWYDPYDYGSYRPYHRREAPAPYVYRPVQPPVFVVPRAPPQPSYVPPRPPERRFENQHRRDERPSHSGRYLGQHLNGGGDRKRNR